MSTLTTLPSFKAALTERTETFIAQRMQIESSLDAAAIKLVTEAIAAGVSVEDVMTVVIALAMRIDA